LILETTSGHHRKESKKVASPALGTIGVKKYNLIVICIRKG